MLVLRCCLIVITMLLTVEATTTTTTITIYEALESHGLPIGLLPKGVKEFSIKNDGNFEAHLDHVCRSKLDNQFEYKRDISGKLSYGRLGNLTGMESLELFVWVSVNEIRVDIPNSGRIHFDLEKGVHKELSLSLFETPADCVAVSVDRLVTDTDASVVNDEKFDGILESCRFGQKRSGRDIM